MGEYPDQSSEMQAVVDMFGPADLTDTADLSGFGQLVLQVTFGGSVETRRSASPITYFSPGGPPFRRLTFVRLERLGVVAVCAEAAALDG